MPKLPRTCLAVCAAIALTASGATAQTELSLWSHWADQPTKIHFIETAIDQFKKSHPDVSFDVSWYQKPPLFAALKGALQAGEAPDIFYCEPGQTEYIDNGFLLPLNDYVDRSKLKDWAASLWTHDGKFYALPLEGFTVELYYNKDLLSELGFDLPKSLQFSADTFAEMVDTASAQDITAIVQGVGDRPYPGAYFTHEMLLKELGTEDYGRLLNGDLSWTDDRVREVFDYMQSLIDAGAYPKSFSTLKLGESHYYFYSQPGGVTLPMGSWYTSRAFVPPDKGGQPDDFALGIMKVPALPDSACPECKTSNVGGSLCVNSESEHIELAAEFLNSMANEKTGNRWLKNVLVQTGIVSDASTIDSPYQDYFEALAKVNEDAKYFVGLPHVLLKGRCLETFKQVMNKGFPAGQVDAGQATQLMDQACTT